VSGNGSWCAMIPHSSTVTALTQLAAAGLFNSGPHLVRASDLLSLPDQAEEDPFAVFPGIETTTSVPSIFGPDQTHPVPGAGDDPAEAPQGPISSCQGFQRKWVTCDPGPCNLCMPQDCSWGDWTEWKDQGGCTGLGVRIRKIYDQQNECGKPCTGAEEDTASRREYLRSKPECDRDADVDCEWGDWSDWSVCGSVKRIDPFAQSIRNRQVKKEAYGRGLPCEGVLSETKSCGKDLPMDCALTEWGAWTECSATCGQGWRAQMRRIRQEARFGGLACSGPLRRTVTCSSRPCDSTCEVSSWTNWEGCSSNSVTTEISSRHQRYRHRRISRYSPECDIDLQETAGCPKAPGADGENIHWCQFALWSSWSTCGRACGGGQKTRSRTIIDVDSCIANVHEPLQEVSGCGEQLCDEDESHCDLSAWSAWSDCSETCGTGVAVRSRALEGADVAGACLATLREAKACQQQVCERMDCRWGDWTVWASCSASCDGGVKRRSRAILQPPLHGGLPCIPKDMEEVAPCNMDDCLTCADGKWSDWAFWTACSGTCAPAYKRRERHVAQFHNHCGQPATGPEEEYSMCADLATCGAGESQDCLVSEWKEWSGCSSTCSGIKERVRKIERYRTGDGLPCLHSSLKEVAPCHTTSVLPGGSCATTTRDCEFGKWDDWSTCSKTCGGGERTRLRQVVTPNSPGGAPCEEALAEIAPCSVQDCAGAHIVDCLWGQWESWSGCTRECGGERYRQRSIEQMPTMWGRRCDPGAAKMVQSCHATESCQKDQAFCIWSAWAEEAACSATCGSASRTRQRHLTVTTGHPVAAAIFMEGTEDMTCAGIQTMQAVCEGLFPCEHDCQPVDCKLTSWSMWSEPSCLQLCERTRSVDQESHCGGVSCNGSLLETKQCLRECDKEMPCILGSWGYWSSCADKSARQQSRARQIVQEAQNGGTPCTGMLAETQPCPAQPVADNEDCVLREWASWSTCSEPCGGGMTRRMRRIAQEAAGTGKPCSGVLMEVSGCNELSCVARPEDCLLAAWSSWSSCTAHGVEARERSIHRAPDPGGAPCSGSLHQVRPCFSAAVDCRVSAWTPWDACDKSCGGGQTQRQRQVFQSPRHGGKACPTELVQVADCKPMPCPSDTSCLVGTWTEWGVCSSSCGSGYKSRLRFIHRHATDPSEGCRGELTEAASCQGPPCDCEGCLWGDWEDWNTCSRSCDGGQRQRHRDIARWPRPGCGMCEAKVKVMAEACNEEACSLACVDGQWGDWHDWEECSSSCEGGITWRSRTVNRTANHCGKAAQGRGNEVKPCMHGVPCSVSRDCAFSDWSAWSACSATCSGTKTRSRKVQAPAVGSGLQCTGAITESTSCAYDAKSPLLDWTNADMYMGLISTQDNNLGGQGPARDSSREVIRFPGVATLDSQIVDLLVKATSEYVPGDPALNGLQGSFGNINVRSGTSTGMIFELVDQRTGHPVIADDVHLKFFDLDDCIHSATTITAITPCNEFYASQGTAYEVDGFCDGSRKLDFHRPRGQPECPTGHRPKRFRLEEVVLRNLAGVGPDFDGAQEMRFASVLESEGEQVDLVITSVPGPSDAYQTSDASKNGHYGRLGVIDVAPLTKAMLRFEFVASGSHDHVAINNFNISFFDIDQPNVFIREEITVKGSAKCFLRSSNSTLEHRRSDGGFTITSTVVEGETPAGPERLTEQQEELAVDCHFSQASVFEVDLAVRAEGDYHLAGKPPSRVFLFSGQACAAPGEQVIEPEHQPGQTACQSAHPQVAGVGPATQTVERERDSVSLRFRGVSKVHLEMAAEGKCCSHNFLFAGKVCLGGRCDTCDEGKFGCSFLPWSPWTECDLSCGGGRAERHRQMVRIPIDSAEGESCNGTLAAVRSCNVQGCAQDCLPVDCTWGDWEDWSPCGQACGGVRTRNRRVNSINACGGLACLPADAQTYESCPHCDEKFCVWGDWSDTGQCSATCGEGTQLRERRLGETSRRPPDLIMKAEHRALVQRIEASEHRRLRGVVGSFAVGLLSCVALLAVVFRRSRSHRPRWSQLHLAANEGADHDELSPITRGGAAESGIVQPFASQRMPLL